MNRLLLDTLAGKKTSRAPVWFMRQAGRCLPSYMALREKYSFAQLMEDPELAKQVTLLPVNELGVDAAILFSDILIVPQALGMKLDFTENGPRFAQPLCTIPDVLSVLKPNSDVFDHVYQAIRLIRKEAEVPLIGFCGGPLTVLLYMLEGLGTDHDFKNASAFIRSNIGTTRRLLDAITDISIEYVRGQIAGGIQAFQLFETWAGIMPADFYFDEIMPRCRKILFAARFENIPTIFFPRALGSSLSRITRNDCDGLGVDWQSSMKDVRKICDKDLVLQGNLDPRLLLSQAEMLDEQADKLLHWGHNDGKWIFNFGHGVLPGTSASTLKKLVDRNSRYGRD